ncbi:MAG TPA: ferric reductase-like transmembrane domain-containing protein [Lapillicoccus sp.]|nr:ferric reductase-like transmembrane domain-containing protein [Lapillicoccus sp.]
MDPRWWRQLAMALGLLSIVIVLALWVAGQAPQELGSLAGALHAFGRLTALLASNLLLIQVILMARIPFLEKAFGQDSIVRTHRLVGFTSFNLMLAHLVLTTLGYAASTQLGIWGTMVDFVVNYPGMLLAVAGTVCLVMVVVTSMRAARARLRYESWHLIHLYAYLGVALALPHQLWTGQDFVGNLAATVFWWTLYAVAAGCVIGFRVVLPLVRSRRHQLVVDEVRRETFGVTTVVVSGRDLDRLGARAGQYLLWRFLDRPGWTRAHPFSLSAAPDGSRMRITAVHVGDGSTGLDQLKPGARVFVEGPYGRLHEGVRSGDKVLLMASGIGVTPMRALLEGLPQRPGDVVLLYRVHSIADVLFRDELAALALDRGARVVTIAGPRIRGRDSWLPDSAAHLEDVEALLHLVPDVAERDLYLCGNAQWMEHARNAALGAGVLPDRIHVERFVW